MQRSEAARQMEPPRRQAGRRCTLHGLKCCCRGVCGHSRRAAAQRDGGLLCTGGAGCAAKGGAGAGAAGGGGCPHAGTLCAPPGAVGGRPSRARPYSWSFISPSPPASRPCSASCAGGEGRCGAEQVRLAFAGSCNSLGHDQGRRGSLARISPTPCASACKLTRPAAMPCKPTRHCSHACNPTHPRRTCMSEVQSVRLSRSSCMMSVLSL